MYYMKYANQAGLTAQQALLLDGIAHELMASILRTENKHNDALVSIIYVYANQLPGISEKQKQGIKAYFISCALTQTTFENALDELGSIDGLIQIPEVQSLVREWLSRG